MMVGGFNTNVRYEGRMFHVQTEDSGEASPLVSTLLYEGGAILHSRRTSYADVMAGNDLESAVRSLMEKQHGSVVADLKAGKLDDEIHRVERDRPVTAEVSQERVHTFGEGIISESPLHQVILEQLAAD